MAMSFKERDLKLQFCLFLILVFTTEKIQARRRSTNERVKGVQVNICPEKCRHPECPLTARLDSSSDLTKICTDFFQTKFNSVNECEKKCYGCNPELMVEACNRDKNEIELKDKFADCRLKPSTGLCRGHFIMWYYNVKSKSCKTFVYGGCGGNANRFRSNLSCLLKCGLLAFPFLKQNHEEL